ncbi:MAG: hypothetical protein J6M40_02535 [Prevotella sp.]|nr:hypothetical protein [Prevotella sp.]
MVSKTTDILERITQAVQTEQGYQEKAAFICNGMCATINHIWELEAYSAQDFMPLIVMAEYMRVIKDMAKETH